MERKWCTRAYKPGDEEAIVALWRLVFPNGESGRGQLGYWYWQFRDLPAGAAAIRLATIGERIVGQYAVIPVPMQIQGKAILGTLSLDTMTHPEFRRQGMFTTLADELYDELTRAGLPITYGFPNENSVDGFVKKLQWVHVCSLPVYVKPLRSEEIVDMTLANPLLRTVFRPLVAFGTAILGSSIDLPTEARNRVRWLEQFDVRADKLWAEVYDRTKIAVTRSAAFLNWRYFQNPLRGYRAVAYEEGNQLIAYAVVRSMDQFGLCGVMITDLVSQLDRDDALLAVLAAVEAYCAKTEADLIACLLHGDERTTKVLRRHGFLKAPRQAFKEWHFGVRVNGNGVDTDLVHRADSWYLTFCDTDVV